MNFDSHYTPSSREQRALEEQVSRFYEQSPDSGVDVALDRSRHIRYLQDGLRVLPRGFSSLEAARPWLLYWLTHSLALLGADLPDDISVVDAAAFLSMCQSPGGGFGGSPGQPAHLAPTYAAVAAAVTLGGAALSAVDRPAMADFLRGRCVSPDAGGGFEVCIGGETDVRGCYTAVATAHMLKLDKHELAGRAGMVEYIRRCQTYEGGLGGEPGNEAHGGYTYCGLAALSLVGQANVLDLRSLLHFAARCQGTLEGGFMGRTNKLVDGCYSFWQGGIFPLLQRLGPDLLAQSSIPAPPDPVADGRVGELGAEDVAAAGSESDPDLLVVPGHRSTAPMTLPQQAASASSRAQAAAEERLKRLQALKSAERSGVDSGQMGAAERIARDALDAAQQAERRASKTEELLQVCTASSSDPGRGPVLGSEAQTAAGAPTWRSPLFDAAALRSWILLCCQAAKGGLRDKPGKPPDFYHTCYCLSGLSLAQHAASQQIANDSNLLAKTDPLCNVLEERLEAAQALWS